MCWQITSASLKKLQVQPDADPKLGYNAGKVMSINVLTGKAQNNMFLLEQNLYIHTSMNA